MSKARLAVVSKRGGVRAHQTKKVHQYTPAEASAAGHRGNISKKAAAAERAKVFLRTHGVTDAELAELTQEGLIYYGGSRTNPSRLAQLRTKLDALQIS